MAIRKNDKVKIIAGRGKGKVAKVLGVDSARNRVIVEGLTAKRHLKRGRSQANPEGGVVEREVSIHASNVMLVDPESGKPVRVSKIKREEKRAA